MATTPTDAIVAPPNRTDPFSTEALHLKVAEALKAVPADAQGAIVGVADADHVHFLLARRDDDGLTFGVWADKTFRNPGIDAGAFIAKVW